MPQPLSKKYNADVSIENAAASRQEQALNAANALSKWAKLDAFMPVVFNGLVKGDPTAAQTAFSAIRNFKTRQQQLQQQAKISLDSQEDRDILDAILKLYDSTAKSRDKIAHHLWGTHPKLPDSIVLVDPKIIRQMSTSTRAHSHNGDMSFEDVVSYQEDIRNAMMVWRTNDFVEVAQRTHEAMVCAITFSIMLPQPDRPHLDDGARQILLGRPLIREFVDRREEGRKKSQAK